MSAKKPSLSAMRERSTHHATFVIERNYDASPARVFAAWAEPTAKARWFVGPAEWEASDHELDFRVGGRESVSGCPPGGPVHEYNACYQDIVPDQRIVYSYDMHLNETRTSVSLATVEFTPEGSGTRLIYTEQDVFLDGIDNAAARERGTRDLLDNLEAELKRTSA
ncbi:SRPBCC family protein [Pseudomonas sp. 2FE]|uniref:SRPBCC family protein n=1 Tax=Pseudomonas sp. 2FE TaxID=2502190 RepID=UPI001C498F7D|nr:SRPBCC family protein [Pseudomonas sp. 2FE]